MFEMGFIEDVEDIIRNIPSRRQTLMFSATISWDVETVMESHLTNPRIIRAGSQVDPSKLSQVYYDIPEQGDKLALLVHLLGGKHAGLSIVFCATRHESDLVSRNLRANGINAMAIHGGMSQASREESLESLRKERIDVLVATDVAARGLDIKNVTRVYNYDVPKTSKEYIHRIGRTARAGESGQAVTLLTHRDHDNFRRVLGSREFVVEREELPAFRRIPFRRFDDGPRHGFGSRGRGRYRSGDRYGHGDRGRRPPGDRHRGRR
jgi:ATP-dependent RNA helicase DeaD